MQNDSHNAPTQQPSDDLAGKVLGRIQEEKVVPRPRWQFLVKDHLAWVLLALCLMIGAAAAGAMMFTFANAGWTYRMVTHDSWISFVIETAPVVWILIFVGVIVAVIENIRHTKHGYRYSFSILLVFGLLGTLVGGALVFASGLGKRVDEEIGPRLHIIRRPAVVQQQRIWSNPSKGLLAGEIVSMEDGAATFRLRTFDGKEWMVNGEDLNDQSRKVLSRSRLVRVIGVPLEQPDENGSTFRSCFVFPWEVMGAPSRPGDPHASRLLFIQMTSPPPQETNPPEPRTTECEGVRPYAFLKKLQSEFHYEE